MPSFSENTVIHKQQIIISGLNLFLIRYMLWKIQSGIAPPFFYVIVAEKDKLNTLRGFLCPQIQNVVQPIVHQPNQMYTVNT